MPKLPEESPSPDVVEKFHRNSDADGSSLTIHHTLGIREGQASPGNHNHDGGNSTLLLEDITLTGSRGSSTAMLSIIQALVKLGATDSTTA